MSNCRCDRCGRFCGKPVIIQPKGSTGALTPPDPLHLCGECAVNEIHDEKEKEKQKQLNFRRRWDRLSKKAATRAASMRDYENEI